MNLPFAKGDLVTVKWLPGTYMNAEAKTARYGTLLVHIGDPIPGKVVRMYSIKLASTVTLPIKRLEVIEIRKGKA